MTCPVFHNHAVRKDGSCSRYHLCATQGVLYAGKIGGSIDKTGIISFPITKFPGCKAVMVTGFTRGKMEVRRKMAKKTKKIKREVKAANGSAATPEVAPVQDKFSDDQFIEALRGIGKPATSRDVVNALGITDFDYGRALVRRTMERLEKEGKVKSSAPAEKIRATKLYSLP
jgi:hypothetical protein